MYVIKFLLKIKFIVKILRNIQNVIALVESGTGAKHALLVNCHFDSVPQSPGRILVENRPYVAFFNMYKSCF